MSEITFLAGSSRTWPYTLANRIAPAGIEIPRPFDITHMLKNPIGRSTGGAFKVMNYESMVWSYQVGTTALYTKLMSFYNPVNPWVWIYYADLHSTEGAWWEASMQEPKVNRGAGNTVANIAINFTHLSRYT